MIEEIKQKQIFLDQFSQAWTSDYQNDGGKIFCTKGCSACCSLMVRCTWPEALIIASEPIIKADYLHNAVMSIQNCAEKSTDLKDWLSRYRQQIGACPFLDHLGACSIYQLRPLSCRALLSTATARWCATDFSKLSSIEKQEYMDGLDRTAAAFPTHYAACIQELGCDLESAAEKLMKAEYGFSVSGNLPFLVWLCLQFNTQEIFAKGIVFSVKFLREENLYNPYLISLDT